MPITRTFRETVLARAQKDAAFRHGLLAEAMNELLSGDAETAKSLLRDYINATISFKKMAKALHKNSKSLQRMLGANGNPRLDNVSAMLATIQKKEHVKLEVRVSG